MAPATIATDQESGRGYHVLLVFLLAMFVLAPLLRLVPGMNLAVNGAVIVGSLGVTFGQRGPFLMALALGAPLLVLVLMDPAPGDALHVVTSAYHSAFDLFLALLVLTRVLRHRRVTAGTVSGSLCVYLLLGVAWAYAYDVLLSLDPEAFRGVDVQGPPALASDLVRGQLLYLSMVTLTTLGYGDLTPASATARSMAVVEATVGQLFLVAVVARLVGLQISHSLRGDDDAPHGRRSRD